MNKKPIGYITKKNTVVCEGCASLPDHADGLTKLYFVNIFPYTQTCHDCSKALVTGSFSTELFPKMEVYL